MQRMLLRHMAIFEVQQAEKASKAQDRHYPPCGWSIARLFRQLAQSELQERVVEAQRQRHQQVRQEWLDLEARALAGDEYAQGLLNLRLSGAALAGKRPAGSVEEEFQPSMPRDWEQFNATRLMRGLVTRGFVCRRGFAEQFQRWALTREGFAEARRLGDVPDSEIVDLDQLAENWCDTARLPFTPLPLTWWRPTP